jgi:excisionase family DNA binding protein
MKPDGDGMPGPVMTANEVAQYLRVHQSTLYKLIRRGEIQFFKVGSDYRFNREAIEKWIADRRVDGRLPDPDASRLLKPPALGLH